MGLPRTFRDPSGLFSYTIGVNALTGTHRLWSFRDFIVAQLKRVKKHSRFKKGQRWIHRVQFRRATYYCYPLDSDDDPLIFPQTFYCDVTEPEIVFVLDLEAEMLMTKEEWDASI